MAHQGTLRKGEEPGLSGWPQCNHSGPQKWERKAEEGGQGHRKQCADDNRSSVRAIRREGSTLTAGFEDGGRGHTPRNAGASGSWERQGNSSSPRASGKKGSPFDTQVLGQ